MKRTLIATFAATAAILAAAYLTGADGTTAPTQTGSTTGMTAPTRTTATTGTTAQTPMQGPMTETETIECDDYILLIPCPVCHTCPVCQSNSAPRMLCAAASATRNRRPARLSCPARPGCLLSST